MRRYRWILWCVLLGGLAVGGWVVAKRLGGAPPRTTFQTAVVDRGRITAQVTASGTVSALVTVQVGSQTSGRLKEILVDFNSPVTQGQVIARIDPLLQQSAVAMARANLLVSEGDLARIRVQLEDAGRQAERARVLFERKIVSEAERDTALASARALKAQVLSEQGKLAQARAQLRQAEINLAYTTIQSPINGVVISRAVDVGQTVAASFQTPTLFTIAEDLRKMQVDTSVSESDIGKLRPGLAASFTVDAYPGKRFVGKVRQIRNAPQTVQNVVTYDAVVDVDNPDLELKPGMTASVTFVTADKPTVVRVPNAALRFRPTAALLAGPGRPPGGGPMGPPGAGPQQGQGWKTVWCLRDGKPRPVPVQVGITDGRFTELVAGDLRAGDRVITSVSSGSPMSFGGPGRPGGGPPGGPRPF